MWQLKTFEQLELEELYQIKNERVYFFIFNNYGELSHIRMC